MSTEEAKTLYPEDFVDTDRHISTLEMEAIEEDGEDSRSLGVIVSDLAMTARRISRQAKAGTTASIKACEGWGGGARTR